MERLFLASLSFCFLLPALLSRQATWTPLERDENVPILPATCLQDPEHGGKGAGQQSHFMLTLLLNNAQAQSRALHSPVPPSTQPRLALWQGSRGTRQAPPALTQGPVSPLHVMDAPASRALPFHLLGLRYTSARDTACPPSRAMTGYSQRWSLILCSTGGVNKNLFSLEPERGTISL